MTNKQKSEVFVFGHYRTKRKLLSS